METIVKEFEPTTLYVDQKRIGKILKEYRTWASEADLAVKEAEKLFDNGLSDEQKEDVLKNGWQAVERILKETSQFPNADTSTLLKLMGKDGTAAKEALVHIPTRNKAVGFTVVNGSVVVKESVENDVLEKCTVRTSSREGNEALEVAKTLVEGFKTSLEKGWLTNLEASQLPRTIKLVKYDLGDEGHYKMMPNFDFIRGI